MRSPSNFKFRYLPGWGWVEWVESRIKLISAEAEAEALLGLVELGNNHCRLALRNGVREGNGEDLLTECKNLLAALGIKDVSTGFSKKQIIKKASWKANKKQIKGKVTTVCPEKLEPLCLC